MDLPYVEPDGDPGGITRSAGESAFVEARELGTLGSGDEEVSPQELLRYVRGQPFRPFRIQMVSGRTFDIRHPEMVRVGRRDLLVFKFVGDTPEVYDDWDAVSLLLIESISYLETAVA
jgi:hypothetical protein